MTPFYWLLRSPRMLMIVLFFLGFVTVGLRGIGMYDGAIRVIIPSRSSRSSQSSHQSVPWTWQSVSGDLFWTPWHQSLNRWIQAMGKPQVVSWWLYQFTSRDMIRVWRDWVRDGVGIGLILEHNKFRQSNNDVRFLLRSLSGDLVAIRSDAHLGINFMHAKAFVSDGTGIIQTANLTHSSLTKNIEHFVVVTDPQIVADLARLHAFDRTTTRSYAREQPFVWHPNLVVCPWDCREKYLALINGAKSSIRTMQQYITDPEIEQALRAARTRGVDVRIQLGDLPANKAFAHERGEGAHVPSRYIHSKSLLVDDRWLLVGSMNMSINSLDNNREIGIVLTNRDAIEEWKVSFMQYWEEK